MAIVGPVRRKKVHKNRFIAGIDIGTEGEIVLKMIKELLLLFHLPWQEGSSGAKLKIENFFSASWGKTVLRWELGLEKRVLSRREPIVGILSKAEEHRLIKLNLFFLLGKIYGLPVAPWGILHGIRPTKIIHRYIDSGKSRAEILQKCERDYLVSPQKAKLLTDIAFFQRPILKTSTPQTVSIYIGVPFCRSRCLYCSFPANIMNEKNMPLVDAFMVALKKEVEATKELLQHHHLKVQNVYIGGGTPSSLPEKYFAQLLAYAREMMDNSTYEFTVEAGRPDTLTVEKMQLMADAGVDRISLNPQTMQEKTLHLIGRQHTPQDIVHSYEQLRAYTSAKINMDLILGLPNETVAEVADTLTQVLRLAPEDITVHALALKKGSNLKINQDKWQLPSDSVVQEMGRITEEALVNARYVPYYLYRQGYISGQLENIGYAQPGAWSMYNIQIMSEKQTILGIGGNASTKIVSERGEKYLHTVFNPKDLLTYLRNVDTYIEKKRVLAAQYL